MYIIDVIPLIVLPPQAPQIASYFHSVHIPKGSLVEAPYNRRVILGIAVSSIDIEKEKTFIKKSSFQLQKIKRVLDSNRVFDFQFEDAKYISQRYSSSLGVTLKTILPPFSILKRKIQIKEPAITKKESKERLFISGSIPKRFEYIEKKIRDRKGQVLIVFPDSSIAKDFLNSVKDKNKVLITSSTKNPEWLRLWDECIDNRDLIVIGTRQSLFLPFSNLETIIMDDPYNEMYKSEMTPKYESLDIVERKADIYESSLILTGATPSIEIWYKIYTNKYDYKNLGSSKVSQEIIDMGQEISNNNFSALAQISKKTVIESLLADKRVLIYSSRKGYSAMLACNNCGLAVTCPNCSAGMRVYRTDTLDLICHHCGHKSAKLNNCARCHDYNLKPVGAGGSQKIYEEMRKLLEINELKVPVVIIDTSVVQNETEEEELLETIEKSKASVVIATEMIASHRFRLNFETIIIPYSDSLWSFPDFRAEDKLISVIENLKALEPKNLLIQTLTPESPLIKTIASKDYEPYIKQSLKDRRSLAYPPFSRLVKLTYSHRYPEEARKQSKIASEKMKRAISYLKLEDKIKIFDTMPSFIHKVNNMYRYNIVFKVLDKNLDLSEFLSYTPPRWIIDVDARSVV